MARNLLWFLAVILASYLVFTAVLFVFQRSLIYLPQPRSAEGAATLALPNDAGELMVTIRPHEGRHALIYFGGNAEDVSLNLPDFSKAFPEHALYLMHYRGFAGSSGSPSEEAIHSDAAMLFDHVATAHSCILVMGRSLGSGVATRLASERPAAGLILITPFNSLEELAARQFPFVPVRWLLKDRYQTWRYASQVEVPTLLIAARHDRIVPLSSTETLATHFGEGVARLRVIDEGGHNTLHLADGYLDALAEGRSAPKERCADQANLADVTNTDTQ